MADSSSAIPTRVALDAVKSSSSPPCRWCSCTAAVNGFVSRFQRVRRENMDRMLQDEPRWRSRIRTSDEQQSAVCVGLHWKTLERMTRAGEIPAPPASGVRRKTWKFYASEL